MERSLDGKVALVTGASRGIGRAIAVKLGSLGARVVVNFKENEARADEAARSIADAGGTAELARADVAKPAEARRLVEEIVARHRRLDILVNNAAIQRSAMLHKMSDADWYDVLDLNLSAVFHLCRAALPSMLEARAGSIVNIASASSFLAQKGAAGYVASKHALIGLTKALALETASRGVRVNCVAPGLTDTDLTRNLTDAQRTGLLGLVPQGRIGTPDEVAAMVAFVITDASYSTGNVFHVGGGVVM
jgi:NAD(P)-dependent dehydrogenase (short-subunit alcohol dehydrogenase family)